MSMVDQEGVDDEIKEMIEEEVDEMSKLREDDVDEMS